MAPATVTGPVWSGGERERAHYQCSIKQTHACIHALRHMLDFNLRVRYRGPSASVVWGIINVQHCVVPELTHYFSVL